MNAENAPDAPQPAAAAPEAAAGGAPSSYDHAERDPAPPTATATATAEPGQGASAPGPPSPELANLAAQSAVYATRAFGPGTQRAYRAAWGKYTAWCAGHGLDPFAGAGPRAEAGPLPLYVTHLAETGRAVATIRVALAAIATAYRLAGHPLDLRDPLLAPVVEGVTRTVGSRPRRQAAPAVPTVLRAMLASCGRDEILKAALAARDRAMLLLGFGAALRRSELVALTLADVEIVPGRGVRVRIRRSKTDQQGRGQEVAIWANPADPGFCPLGALETWLKFRHRGADLAGVGESGGRPLFVAVTKGGKLTGQGLSDKAVVRLVKAAAAAAGLDPARYAGHSLRAGLATGAGDAGLGLAEVMRQTRHKSPQVALAYLRPADLWRNNPTETLFGGR
ncbi:site-specific integrase [Acidocella sp.]|jgi:integrase|uniref:site-specific integrase n=1 Tax=Acidocella sp. TaxID=50710 RepID=UPI002F4231CA